MQSVLVIKALVFLAFVLLDLTKIKDTRIVKQTICVGQTETGKHVYSAAENMHSSTKNVWYRAQNCGDHNHFTKVC